MRRVFSEARDGRREGGPHLVLVLVGIGDANRFPILVELDALARPGFVLDAVLGPEPGENLDSRPLLLLLLRRNLRQRGSGVSERAESRFVENVGRRSRTHHPSREAPNQKCRRLIVPRLSVRLPAAHSHSLLKVVPVRSVAIFVRPSLIALAAPQVDAYGTSPLSLCVPAQGGLDLSPARFDKQTAAVSGHFRKSLLGGVSG